MAPPLQVTNGTLIRIIWAFGDEVGVNVVGASNASGTLINQALADSLGAAIKNNYALTLGGRQPAGTVLVRVGVRDIRTPGQAEFLDSGAPQPGTGLGDTLPRGNACCITFRTAGSGKSRRGRIYLGGFSESDNEPDGSINAAALDAAHSFAQSIGTAIGQNGLSHAVISRPAEARNVTTTVTHADGTTSSESKSYAARAGAVYPIILYEARNTLWESQRRRGNGRGVGTVAALMNNRRAIAQLPATTTG